MEDKNTFIDLQLQIYLPWHKARIRFFGLLIISLIRSRSVVYSLNAVVLNNRVTSSNLRGIQLLNFLRINQNSVK